MSVARAVAFLTLITVGPGLSDGCARALGKRDEPRRSASTTPAVPVASATTPPVWTPPEVAPSASAAPPTSPDLVRARAYAQAGEHKKVRALLEKKVRAGKGSKEEAQLLADACLALRDKACVEAAKSKHPEIDGL